MLVASIPFKPRMMTIRGYFFMQKNIFEKVVKNSCDI
nr:MAG TPA: hypothetical protein [Caudoviricetes sp.]